MELNNEQNLELEEKKEISATDNINVIKKDINKVKEITEIVTEKTQVLTQVLKNISNNTDTIKSSTQSIQAISGKTNILSLNASIEAARAGDVGRGFAVVAQQMRDLANNSKTASDQVLTLLNALYQDVDKINTELGSLINALGEQSTCSESMYEQIEMLEEKY